MIRPATSRNLAQIAVFAVVVFSNVATAQISTQSNRGGVPTTLIVRVTDASNNGVAADVALQGMGMLDRTMSTDANGNCFFHSVDAGEYVVVVRLLGQEVKRETLVLNPNEGIRSELIRLPMFAGNTPSPVARVEFNIPESARKSYKAGISHVHNQQWELAETNFRDAIAKYAMYAHAFNALGVVLVMQHRFPEAEIAFRKAITLDEKFAEAHVNLGGLLLQTNRYREAVDEVQRSMTTEPTNARALALLAEAYISVQDDEKAFQLLTSIDNRKIQHDPVLHFRLAHQLEESHKTASAIDQYRRYLAEFPEAPYSKDAHERIHRLGDR